MSRPKIVVRPVQLTPRPLSPGDLFKQLSAHIEPMLLRAGDHLFLAGEPADGVYLIQRGKVKLFYEASSGVALTERLARGGEILGFGPLFTERPWEATAEVLATTRAGFVRKHNVIRFLDEHPEARLSVLRLLSKEVDRCYDLIRTRCFA